MINHGLVQSTVKPDHIRYDDYSVWVADNIVEKNTDDIIAWEYNLTQYKIEEYNTEPTQEERLQALELAMLEIILGGSL